MSANFIRDLMKPVMVGSAPTKAGKAAYSGCTGKLMLTLVGMLICQSMDWPADFKTVAVGNKGSNHPVDVDNDTFRVVALLAYF